MPGSGDQGSITSSANGDGSSESGSPGTNGGSQEGAPGNGQGNGASTSTVYYAAYLELLPEGSGYCSATAYRAFPSAAAAAAFEDSSANQLIWQDIRATYGTCAGSSTAPPVVPSPPVSSTINTWWSTRATDLLPVPRPSIAPGWALAGQAGYLVLGAPLGASFSPQTPAGTFSIQAQGVVYVDWGDGTSDGPYTNAGAPWPNGDITHVWESTGTYSVTVTVYWTARWSYPPLGLSGTLSGLSTTTTFDLPVRQIVSVRNS